MFWATLGLAHAGLPTVVVEAELHPSLRGLSGTVQLRAETPADLDGIDLVDALSALPVPEDDQLRRATFPRGVQQGWVRQTPEVGSIRRFWALLPIRSNAAGFVPGRGLFLNGFWHPQPVRDGAPVPVRWEVHLRLPPGVIGVLNGVIGEDELSWTGETQHLALAVLPRARIAHLQAGELELVLVERGLRRPKRAERLAAVAGPALAPLASSLHGPLLVVDTPDRRSLAQSAPGMVFLSDRTFRVNLGLWTFHAPAVRRALIAAASENPDPYWAAVGAALLDAGGPDARDLHAALRWAAWIPEVDQLLYDGRLPFFTDITGEAWPGDRAAEQLGTLLHPRTPPISLARQVVRADGLPDAQRLGLLLLAGADPALAAEVASAPPGRLEAWAEVPPVGNLRLEVEGGPDAPVATLRREGPDALPPRQIPVQIDGPEGRAAQLWEAPAGPSTTRLPLPAGARAVQLDPTGDERQTTRSDDRWPRRWTPTFAFFPSELALSIGRITAEANVALRQQFDTHNLYLGSLSTSPRDLLGLDLGYVRSLGPLQDHRNRPLRLSVGGGPTLLDPSFRSTAGGELAWGGWAGLSHETRTDTLFPRKGHRLSLGLSAGAVPGGAQWSSAGLGAVGLLGLGGRAALASRVGGAVAAGELSHRLLPLGGGDNFSGLPVGLAIGRQRLTAASELRVQALRFVSVPGPLVWLSDVQLSTGLEAAALSGAEEGCARPGACTWTALGWTAGIGLTGDVFGVRPTLAAISFARPLRVEIDGPVEAPAPALQPYVRLTQPF
ncbi:MAG: hypothetical protein JNM72_10115 [Deltaproteobacteria bacterium]|nr:hypothetical protein [Deltaproteobacteria bacterium]